jgi:hypothetical protein
MSYTKEPRYTQETWLASDAQWRAGRFGPEWSDWRGMAAKAGIIFPPSGSPDDPWSADSPSQRAILIRAIRETPRLLRRAIPGASSWSDVIGRLLTYRDLMALDADQRETDWTQTKARRGAMVPLSDMLGTVADSLAPRGGDR